MTYQLEGAAANSVAADIEEFTRLAVKYGKALVPERLVGPVELRLTQLGFLATNISKSVGIIVFADAAPLGKNCRHCEASLTREVTSAEPLACANCWEVVSRLRGMSPEVAAALVVEALPGYRLIERRVLSAVRLMYGRHGIYWNPDLRAAWHGIPILEELTK